MSDEAEAAPPASHPTTAEPRTHAPSRGPGISADSGLALPRRIVIATAEPGVGDVLEKVLRHQRYDISATGIEVRRVMDGLTCLQEIQLTRPALIILHAQLERVSAPEILQAWDSAHPGDTLPAIILSARFGADVPRGMPGAVVVNLPFDNADFVDLVVRALGSDEAVATTRG